MNAGFLRRFDWILLGSLLPIVSFGLMTMKSVGGPEGVADYFFYRQMFWIAIGLAVFFIFSALDWHAFESNALFLMALWVIGVIFLALLLLGGTAVKGAQSWFHFSLFSVEPSEFMKLVLILILAKYFARRHVEIALWRHIVVSFFWVAVPLLLVILQPDIGSAAVFIFLWGGIVLLSGINLKQFLWLSLATILISVSAWTMFLEPYQKSRIISFLNPALAREGAGYHAAQSVIAVGSGGFFGKGVGYGTQSRLRFLPESETDFIFASFVEEWGFLGALFFFFLWGVIFWRLFRAALHAEGNFAKLVVLGIAILLASHIIIHTGMNVGLLPITGISLPFMSYGGSFFITLMAALGIVESIIIRSSFLAISRDHSEGQVQRVWG